MEASNILSSAAIVLCIGAMVMFLFKAAGLLRVRRDEMLRPTHLNHANMQVPRLKMTRVHIPFTFRLKESGNTGFDEISFVVSSQVKYSIQAFWGVSIRELYISLWRPWYELQQLMESDNAAIVDKKNYKSKPLDLRNETPVVEKIIRLKSPKPPLVLGAPPRLAYPLVIFLIRETENNEMIHPDESVVLVNVVHLRDPVCPLPTSVLAQYLKQSSGQLSCLKQLYLATGDTMSAEDHSMSSNLTGAATGSLSLAEPVACADNGGPLLCSDGPQAEQLCVVCHYFPLSRALLPCRHTCICAVCFSKLDRCPMCRSPITSYFCIRSEEYVPPNFMDTLVHKSKGAVHWLDALNDRLTDFLGFR